MPVGTVPLAQPAVRLGRRARTGLRAGHHAAGERRLSFCLNPFTGLLAPVGGVPPVDALILDVSNGGFELMANKDSDNVGGVSIDEKAWMSAVPAFDDPSGSGARVVTKRHVEPRI